MDDLREGDAGRVGARAADATGDVDRRSFTDAVGDRGVTRHEEELVVGTRETEIGHVRARKTVEDHHVSHTFDRDVEHGDVERVAAVDGDSGQVEHLEDGSVSIPVFEEELVVTKRLVVRERIVIRKRVVSEQQVVEADLRRERVEIEGDVANAEHLAAPGDDDLRR